MLKFPIELYQVKNLNYRLMRWSLLMQDFNLEIRHKKGTENLIDDALFRVSSASWKQTFWGKYLVFRKWGVTALAVILRGNPLSAGEDLWLYLWISSQGLKTWALLFSFPERHTFDSSSICSCSRSLSLAFWWFIVFLWFLIEYLVLWYLVYFVCRCFGLFTFHKAWTSRGELSFSFVMFSPVFG